MNRLRGLALSVGLATLIVVGLACGGGNDEPPTVTGTIAPDLRLTFDGVQYAGAEILGAASPDGSIVSGGTPIDMDDMEVVGAGAWHQTDGDKTVQIYRPKVGGTTDVYTFHPTQAAPKVEGAPPEDEADTTPATWTRWTAGVSPQAPLNNAPSSLSLTDQDRSELIRQTLERALIGNEMIAAGVLVKDNESVVLSTENINASLVPKIPNRNLVLLRPEEIQKRADDQGDFMFLSFYRIGPKEIWLDGGWGVDRSVVKVVLASTLAKGKDSEKTEGYMGGGYFTVEYQQISGEWVGTAQGVAVP